MADKAGFWFGVMMSELQRPQDDAAGCQTLKKGEVSHLVSSETAAAVHEARSRLWRTISCQHHIKYWSALVKSGPQGARLPAQVPHMSTLILWWSQTNIPALPERKRASKACFQQFYGNRRSIDGGASAKMGQIPQRPPRRLIVFNQYIFV